MDLRFKVMNRYMINKKDLISGLVLIISAIFASFHLTNIPFRAAIFPQVMLWGILILSSLLVLKSLKFAKIRRSDRRREIAKPVDEKGKETASEEKDSVLIAASLITVGLYIFLLPILGFFLATILFIFAILFVLKMRRYVLMTFLAIVTSGLVFVIFKTVMYISLPSGIFDPTEYLYRLIGQ
jgi:putative tricarboxylic transport membrane protein